MSNSNITQYPVDSRCSEKVENYLGKNSREYGFSHEKGDEAAICFIDSNKRIFAILNKKKNNLQLADYADSNIITGIEGILNIGDKN